MSRENELYDLSPVELSLLNQGIIQIYGKIDEETEDYAQKCFTILEANNSPDIVIRINSHGGSLGESFAIHDMISLYRGQILGAVVGKACSGANLILQACNVRAASTGSILFVHNMIITSSFNLFRDPKEWQEERDFLEAWESKMYQIYQKRTGKSLREIRKLFRKEKVLMVETAMKIGLIDKIIEPDDISNFLMSEETED